MTLMRRARGSVTDEIRTVAQMEKMDPEVLRRRVASGKVVIPNNPLHDIELRGIGEGLSVKVNVNIGTSKDLVDVDQEIRKAHLAYNYGADAIMDLSTGGDIDAIRRRMIKEVKLPLGTVPIYQAGLKAARESAIVNMTEDDMFNGIEKHAKDGVDFMTVHCGINRESVERLKTSDRITDVVSRGGSFLVAWIIHNDKENPLYQNFDYLLEMARKYDFTLSLGDGLRPGCLHDATDRAQVQELITLGGLVKRARKADVQTMVEGPGHVPMDQIETNMRMEKTICDGAPFYVLGPLVTDIAPGYDHITGAIGGAIAAFHGADFLCYVTPAEHLCLPDDKDMIEGLMASRIAAHAADIARGRGMERDDRMAQARKDLDWEAMYKESLDPEKARRYRARGHQDDTQGCSMCGDVCAIKIVKEHLKKS
ncbi:MAG: phosphomethylpyrimidine synthase ThiC [Euryarchaeota archaeon]|nr:phosphomethylpyrimidine synthase ThiC [Euryarchaeota archaeon]